eukprot:scaffold24083_cov21-Tisochrysis_lutea.AAC.1
MLTPPTHKADIIGTGHCGFGLQALTSLDQSPVTQQTTIPEHRPIPPALQIYRWHASIAQMAKVKGCSSQSA